MGCDPLSSNSDSFSSEQSFQTMDGRNNNNNVIPINSPSQWILSNTKNYYLLKKYSDLNYLLISKTVTCNKIIRHLCLCENSVFSPLFPVVMFGGSQAAAVLIVVGVVLSPPLLSTLAIVTLCFVCEQLLCFEMDTGQATGKMVTWEAFISNGH